MLIYWALKSAVEVSCFCCGVNIFSFNIQPYECELRRHTMNQSIHLISIEHAFTLAWTSSTAAQLCATHSNQIVVAEPLHVKFRRTNEGFVHISMFCGKKLGRGTGLLFKGKDFTYNVTSRDSHRKSLFCFSRFCLSNAVAPINVNTFDFLFDFTMLSAKFFTQLRIFFK